MRKKTMAFGLIFAAVFLSGRILAGQNPNPQAESAANDVGELIKGVQSKDAGIRMSAARNLGALGPKAAAAVPYLIEMLGDRAAFHWDGMTDGRMTGGSRTGAETAAEALVLIGKPALLPLISALSTHKDSTVRWNAAGALGKLNDDRGIEPLFHALADADGSVGEAAAWALGHSKVPGVKDVLFARLGDKTAAVAEGALAALSQQGDARALPILTGRLKGSDLPLRLGALKDLGWLNAPGAYEAVADVLGDQDPRIRRAAASALSDLKDKRSLPGLVRLLGDRDGDVRYMAVVALTNLRDREALEPLRKLLAVERNENIRQAAEAAIDLLSK